MTQLLTILAMIRATAVTPLIVVQAAVPPGQAITPVQTIPLLVQGMTVTTPPAVTAPLLAAIRV